MVTLTHAHGYLHDMGITTDYATEVRINMLAGDTTFEVDNNDYFKLTADFDDGATDEYFYQEHNITNISTDSFPIYLIRWKTSASANGAKARVDFVFTVGSQTVELGYSTTWTVSTGTLTDGKTLDYIRVFADDDGVNGVGFEVYYDFIMIHKGIFTLPNVAHGMNMDFPPQEALIGIPGRDTKITQNLGTDSALINIGCDLDQGNWKRTGDTIDGEVFLDILHNRSSEPWQWLNTGSHQFKVTVHPKFRWEKRGNGTARILDLVLKEYSLGSKADETYAERYGIGL